jgi:hypothetical protein
MILLNLKNKKGFIYLLRELLSKGRKDIFDSLGNELFFVEMIVIGNNPDRYW